jgi:hypothetical protein
VMEDCKTRGDLLLIYSKAMGCNTAILDERSQDLSDLTRANNRLIAR